MQSNKSLWVANSLSMLQTPAVRFLVVGAFCTAFHLALFRQFLTLAPAEIANLLAFALATQGNFVLSYWWTWSRRFSGVREPARAAGLRLLTFNATATAGMGVNSAAFWTAFHVGHLRPMPSAVLAVLASAGVSYLLASRVTFVRRRPTEQPG